MVGAVSQAELTAENQSCFTCKSAIACVHRPFCISYTPQTILDPTNPLLPNTEYTVVVEGTGDGDMVAVKDTGGTPLLTSGTGDSIFHFTTCSGGGIGRG